MRSVVPFFLVAFCCSLASVAEAQKAREPKPTPKASVASSPQATPAPAARPQFRPAVLGTGQDSLINRIDTKALLEKGQKDGAIMFAVLVDRDGKAESSLTYRGMPGTEALNDELQRCLADAKFTPPIYEHQPAEVMLYGTVVFSAQGEPHLHIFLNQDGDEIKEANDFIAPQPVIGADSKFEGLHMPPLENPIAMMAVVDVQLKVDEKGNMQELKVLAEEPPLLGFGVAAQADFAGAKFIPAFRNGDPAASETTLPLAYKVVPQLDSEEP